MQSHYAVLHVDEVLHVPEPVVLVIVGGYGGAVAAAQVAFVLGAFVANAVCMAAAIAQGQVGAGAGNDEAVGGLGKVGPDVVLKVVVGQVGVQAVGQGKIQQFGGGDCFRCS